MWKILNRVHASNHKMSGLSLIELMMSMAISMFLVLGVVLFIRQNTATHIATSQYTSIQDSGRTALSILLDSYKRSGYSGIYSLDSSDGVDMQGSESTAAKCKTGSPALRQEWMRMMDEPVFSIDHSEMSGSEYECITLTSEGSRYNEDYDSDVLVLRHASYEPVSTMIPGQLYLQTALQKAWIFEAQTGGVPPSSVNFEGAKPIATNRIRAFAYYIGDSVETCNDQPIPSLFRYSLDASGEALHDELVLGVERMHAQYLVNVSGTDMYYEPSRVTDEDEWENVKAVKISLLTRNPCPDAAVTDSETYVLGDYTYTPEDEDMNYRRRLFISTIALRN